MNKYHVDSAVSPVIGVMLMLIITLVVAGVIGAYVNNFSTTSTEPQNNIIFDTSLTNDGLTISFLTEPVDLELNKDYYIAISQPGDENEFVILDYVYENVTGNYIGLNITEALNVMSKGLLSLMDFSKELDNGYFYSLYALGNKNLNITSGWITESGDRLNGLPYTVKLIKYDGTGTYGTSSGYSKINEEKSISKPWFSYLN